MKFDDFVDALDKAGWLATYDAQHEKIKQLHAKLFPVITELESDLKDAGIILKELSNES